MPPSSHLVEKVWGGRRLATLLGKELPPEGPVGEAWELADLADGRSRVLAQEGEEQPLDLFLADGGPELVGGLSLAPFPLLYKFIDAQEDLSVQVHPDDALARAMGAGAAGKTECWVILEAPSDGALYVGLADGRSPADLFEALRRGDDPAPLLGRLPVTPGDVVAIPAGTIHAISAGMVLAELQQSSNVTYRLWDWGRLGLDGHPRPLHLDEARRCAKPDQGRRLLVPLVDARSPVGARRELVALCPYFALERLRLDEGASVELLPAKRLEVLSVLDGRIRGAMGDADWLMRPGQSWLVPAARPPLKLDAAEGPATCLRFYLDPRGPEGVLDDFACEPGSEAAGKVSF